MSTGALRAGSAENPYPYPITFQLAGNRSTPDWALTNTVNLGSKFIAAIDGGQIDLHGTPVVKRWARLAVSAPVGAGSITLEGGDLGAGGWAVGQEIVITSSSWNPWQVGNFGSGLFVIVHAASSSLGCVCRSTPDVVGWKQSMPPCFSYLLHGNLNHVPHLYALGLLGLGQATNQACAGLHPQTCFVNITIGCHHTPAG